MVAKPQQITITFNVKQAEHLEELKKLTGKNATDIIRTAMSEYYVKIMNDEEGKKLAKINAFLDVQ